MYHQAPPSARERPSTRTTSGDRENVYRPTRPTDRARSLGAALTLTGRRTYAQYVRVRSFDIRSRAERLAEAGSGTSARRAQAARPAIAGMRHEEGAECGSK
jgi:hypothetical protein